MLINLTNLYSNSHLKKSSGNSECDFPLVCTLEEAQWSDHMPPCLMKENASIASCLSLRRVQLHIKE